VHHDLKSSNILITRNGQNVKLIDFGLSQTDAAHLQNDVQVDIDKFVQVLSLIFPKRYQRLRLRCQKHQFANISALRATIERQERIQNYLPYFVAIIILLISILLSIHTYNIYQESEQMATVAELYITQKHREQDMVDKVHQLVEKQLTPLQQAADSTNTYVEFTQHPAYVRVWQTQATIRDSLANTFSEDPVLRNQCIEVWSISFGERFMQIDTQVKQTKPLQ
jgi:serine/threonine protein kinase